MLYGAGKYTYELVEEWAKIPEGYSMMEVGGLCTDRQDRVYALNRGAHPVVVFDRDGNFQTSWGEGNFIRPHGCCLGLDDSIYCVDDSNHVVSQFTLDGKLIKELGTRGKESDTGAPVLTRPFTVDLYARLAMIKRSGPPFNRPTDVSLSASGNIYVSDGYFNSRIHKFTPDGTLICSWGEPGYAAGQFRLPHGIFVDKHERVWVAERENNRIQIFDDHGNLMNIWTELHRPSDVFVDQNDIVYVSELRQRVSIFTIKGTLLARWDSEGQGEREGLDQALHLDPHAITVDSHGDIYIGEASMTGYKIDRGSKVVRKYKRRA